MAIDFLRRSSYARKFHSLLGFIFLLLCSFIFIFYFLLIPLIKGFQTSFVLLTMMMFFLSFIILGGDVICSSHLGGRGHPSGSPRLPNFVPSPIFGQIGGAGIPNMPKKKKIYVLSRINCHLDSK